MGREASPSAAVLASQSVRLAEKGGGTDNQVGYDAGKRVKGRKIHALVDSEGLPMRVVVHSAAIHYGGAGIKAGIDYLTTPLSRGVTGIITNPLWRPSSRRGYVNKLRTARVNLVEAASTGRWCRTASRMNGDG
jgi:Transposase DDE domain